MDVSKFLFQKETLDGIQKQTNRAAGQARWEELKKLEASGELAKQNTRQDIVKMLGYDAKNKNVLGWVGQKVRRGYLVEELTSTPREYNYYTSGKEPSYDYCERLAKARKVKAERSKAAETTQTAKTSSTPIAVSSSNELTMTIHYGDLVVKFEGITQETIDGIIAKLANKK